MIPWWFKQIAFKKRAIRSKKTYFSYVLDSFPPFLCRKSESLPSLFTQSLFCKDRRDRFALVALYKRAIMCKSLLSLFTKERPWANWSRRSLKKSDGSNSLSFTSKSLFHSFNHKNREICSNKDDQTPNPENTTSFWPLVSFDSDLHHKITEGNHEE